MLNWGVIGFGRMGKQYVDCLRKKSNIFNLIGISSKTNHSDKDFNFYKSYEDLFKSNKIDAVYISTLNNTHKNLVKEAHKYKKKILCEKPLGMNLNEVKELYDLLKDSKNDFVEAIAYRSHPQTFTLLNLLKDKEIGEVVKIESNFGFKVRKIKKESRLFNKDLGGGSILDLGCYPLSFFNLFAKDNNIEVIQSKFNICETNVDIDGEIFLKINDNIDAVGKVSLKENLKNVCKIHTEKASIVITEPWLPSDKTCIEVETKSRYYKKITSSNKSVYDHHIEQSSNFFLKNNSEPNLLVNIEESLQISKMLDIWRNK